MLYALLKRLPPGTAAPCTRGLKTYPAEDDGIFIEWDTPQPEAGVPPYQGGEAMGYEPGTWVTK
jgi:hypothetical protein